MQLRAGSILYSSSIERVVISKVDDTYAYGTPKGYSSEIKLLKSPKLGKYKEVRRFGKDLVVADTWRLETPKLKKAYLRKSKEKKVYRKVKSVNKSKLSEFTEDILDLLLDLLD